MEIGKKIRQARRKKGMSQRELANAIGWQYQNLSQLETGRRTDIAVSTLRKIAKALGVEPGELL